MSVVAAMLLVSASAAAEICVETDENRDNLEAAERSAVRVLVEGILREQGHDVVAAPCAEKYVISSVRLGNSITATAFGAGQTRSRKVRNLEALPGAYGEMLNTLHWGEGGGDAQSESWEVEESDETASTRTIRHSLIFARGSVGIVRGEIGSVAGLGYGFGWRYRFDSGGIELSVVNLLSNKDGNGQFSLVRVSGLHYFSPYEIGSGYMNAGLSYGASGIGSLQGKGIQVEIGLGYEFARASSIRGFIDINAVLPLYTPRVLFIESYLTTFELSLGLGF